MSFDVLTSLCVYIRRYASPAITPGRADTQQWVLNTKSAMKLRLVLLMWWGGGIARGFVEHLELRRNRIGGLGGTAVGASSKAPQSGTNRNSAALRVVT